MKPRKSKREPRALSKEFWSRRPMRFAESNSSNKRLCNRIERRTLNIAIEEL